MLSSIDWLILIIAVACALVTIAGARFTVRQRKRMERMLLQITTAYTAQQQAAIREITAKTPIQPAPPLADWLAEHPEYRTDDPPLKFHG
jgi:hypothetical protein